MTIDTTTSIDTPGSATPLKSCRRCSAETVTSGHYCPECGASYVHRPARLSAKTWRAIGASGTAVLVLLLLVGGIALKIRSDNEAVAEAEANQQAARDAESVVAAAKAEQDAATARESAQAALLLERQKSVRGIEASVTKMAKGAVRDGILDGPILSTSCTPAAGGGSLTDASEASTKFSCFATTKNNSDGTSNGYKFYALMDWTAGTYTYGMGDS